jgi:hypothetical protein
MICGFSFCRRFSFQLLPSASPHAIYLGAIFDFVFGSGRRGDLRFSFQYFSISVFSISVFSIRHLPSVIRYLPSASPHAIYGRLGNLRFRFQPIVASLAPLVSPFGLPSAGLMLVSGRAPCGHRLAQCLSPSA